jgi:hypothetical protein
LATGAERRKPSDGARPSARPVDAFGRDAYLRPSFTNLPRSIGRATRAAARPCG